MRISTAAQYVPSLCSALVHRRRVRWVKLQVPVVVCSSIYMRHSLCALQEHFLREPSQPAQKARPSSPPTHNDRPSRNRIPSHLRYPPPTSSLLSLGARQTRLPRLVLPASLLPPTRHRKRSRASLRSHGHKKLAQHPHHQQHRPLAAPSRDCWDFT